MLIFNIAHHSFKYYIALLLCLLPALSQLLLNFAELCDTYASIQYSVVCALNHRILQKGILLHKSENCDIIIVQLPTNCYSG